MRTTLISALLLSCAVLFAAERPAVSTTGEPAIERVVVEPGKTLTDFVARPTDYTQTDINPGIAPEGDYLGFSAFTRDGNRVLLTNRMTNNVTVFDWTSRNVITNISVGDYPGGIACTDSFAVITLGFVDSVVIMRLSDYSIAARLPSGTQPWVVRISPDQRKAYVACDISNTCEVYDLENLTHSGTISGFPIFLSTFSWNSENARNSFTFSGFEVTPDGSHLVLPAGNDSIFFYDTASGACDDTITGVGTCRFLALSGDGAKFVTANEANPAIAYQFDVTSHAVTGAVTLTGLSLMTYETAVNQDGAKAFFGVSGNQSALVRFASSDFITFGSTYTAFWVGVSPDHSQAISGQYNFSIIDFASEEMVGQHSGNSQSVGSISPIGNRAVGFDPHRHEGLYFYDYTTPGPGMYLGTTNSGLDPEGDAPHRVAVSPNGLKAICTSVLSDNASIIDLESGALDTILPVGDRPQEIAFTSDSRWAVITGGNSFVAEVVDMSDNTIAAEIPTGSGPFTVSIAPNDSFAWVGNIGSNTVTKIHLQGSASHAEAEIPVGEIGMIWGAYGMPSATRVSPTGRYVLVAVSFTDEVSVIDAQTNSIVATVGAGDFPLDFAFNAAGDYAIVTNALGNTISVLHVQGESTAVVTTVGRGQLPCRLAYNPVLDQVGIINLSSNNMVNVEPETGNLLSTVSFSSYGNPVQVQFDENGKPIVGVFGSSVPGYIIRDTQVIATTAVPCWFDYSLAGHRAAVASPGPDWVTLIDWNPAGILHRTVSPAGSGLALRAPSIARTGSVPIAYELPASGRVEVSVFDLTGARVARVASGNLSRGIHLASWLAGTCAPGVYYVRLEHNGRVTQTRVLLTE